MVVQVLVKCKRNLWTCFSFASWFVRVHDGGSFRVFRYPLPFLLLLFLCTPFYFWWTILFTAWLTHHLSSSLLPYAFSLIFHNERHRNLVHGGGIEEIRYKDKTTGTRKRNRTNGSARFLFSTCMRIIIDDPFFISGTSQEREGCE